MANRDVPGPAVPPRADEPCPAWEDGKHMFYYRRVPGGQALNGNLKVCICGAYVGLTERGRECLEADKKRERDILGR